MGRTRKLLPAKAGKRLRSLEYGNEMGVFIKIGLRTASAAAESRHRARPDLQRFRVPHSGSAPRPSTAESLHYVSGLPVPSLNRVRPPRRNPITMGRTRKLLPAKAGKRLRSLEYGNEMGVFIKIGLRTASAAAESRHRARPDLQRFRVPHSGAAPRPPRRSPFTTFRAYQSLLSTASTAAESLHDGKDP